MDFIANFTQRFYLNFIKDDRWLYIADGLKDGTLRPDMKASTEIREWVKQFLPDSVTKVRLSDILFVESGKRIDAANLENYVFEDENTVVADDASLAMGIYMWEHGLLSYEGKNSIQIRLYKKIKAHD